MCNDVKVHTRKRHTPTHIYTHTHTHTEGANAHGMHTAMGW